MQFSKASSLFVSVVIILSIYFSRNVIFAEKVKSNIRRSEGGIGSRSLQTVVVGKVDKLILYNAYTDQPIFILSDGMVVNTATLNASSFNVVATTVDGTVGSIKFGYNGNDNKKMEGTAPYAFCGNSGADFYVCPCLVVGQHNLTVTTYAGKKLTGTIGSVETLSFRIVDTQPTIPPTMAPLAPLPTMPPTIARLAPVPTMPPTIATLAPVTTMLPTIAPLAPVPTKNPLIAPIAAPTVTVSCNIPKVCQHEVLSIDFTNPF